MTLQKTMVRKNGWDMEESALLWDEVNRGAQNGEALRLVFDRVAEKTGRKPNSIRNNYYLCLKSGEAPGTLCRKRALPFVPFAQDEVHTLLREVLKGRAQGESVRACVYRLAEGDKQKALRLQNKYRAILKNQSEYIDAVMEELAGEGVVFTSDFTPVRRKQTSTPSGAKAALMRELKALGPQGETLLCAVCDYLTACLKGGDLLV